MYLQFLGAEDWGSRLANKLGVWVDGWVGVWVRASVSECELTGGQASVCVGVCGRLFFSKQYLRTEKA